MYKTLRRLRIAISIAMAALLGWLSIDAGLQATPVGQWLARTQIVGAILAGGLTAAVWCVLWVLVTVTCGRVYCSSACPMGTLMDVSAHLGRRIGRGPAGRYRYMPPLNALRYPIAAIVACCAIAGLDAIVIYTSPDWAFARIAQACGRPLAIGVSGIAAAALIFVVVIYISWSRGRLICNSVCPLGGVLGAVSRAPIYRMAIDTDKCIGCGLCEDACKAQCINLNDHTVDASRCVMCLDCAAVCPNSAIILHRGRFRLSTPLMQPTMQCRAEDGSKA